LKILELADLPARLGPQLGALNWLDGDPPSDAEFLHRLRKLGAPVSDYQALFAVEGGQVLGKVETAKQSYVSPAGAEWVVWVSGVETRPDALRRGIARTLLNEVHDRERSAGRRWSILWTHRTWVAHQMYEKLGYTDVYAPPAALQKLPRSQPRLLPMGYDWRPAKSGEHEVLESLLQESSRGRYGFIPRYAGSFRLRFRLGWRRPSDFHILSKDSKDVGYAQVSSSRDARSAYEVVVANPRYAGPMLDALESSAQGRWIALARTTFITDHLKLFRKRGYAVYRRPHPTMMAKSLRPGPPDRPNSNPSTVCRSARFQFHGGDVF
jgi:GNAT superfamily N-acetyltransferase